MRMQWEIKIQHCNDITSLHNLMHSVKTKYFVFKNYFGKFNIVQGTIYGTYPRFIIFAVDPVFVEFDDVRMVQLGQVVEH